MKLYLVLDIFPLRNILPTQVQKAVDYLSVESGIGLDSIMVKRFIKLASQILMHPLADLFNLCVYMWATNYLKANFIKEVKYSI